MYITRIKLKNWRNFTSLDVPLRDVSFVLGANASGKSNLLDAFRFLRDIAKSRGGGLQTAVSDRDGMSKLRCLHARRDPEVSIEVMLSEKVDGATRWRYLLGFKQDGKGAQRTVVSREEVEVWDGDRKRSLLSRPLAADQEDPTLLTQTHLEQIQTNAPFREVVDFFSSINYIHLVPQLLKYADKFGGRRLENDPFGQGFLERVAKTPEKTRDARLSKIGQALQLAVPQFKDIRFVKDEIGRPHLEARYSHHRPNAGWQREEHFSDGTLRMLAMLWSLLDGTSLLLLEEPELSLNDAIVKEIPLILQRLQRDKKTRRQIVITTHSEALLSNPGIDGRSVVVLTSSPEGTSARALDDGERTLLQDGLSVADVVLPKTRPDSVEQLGFWK